MRVLLFIIVLFSVQSLKAQIKKSVNAISIFSPLKIDGVLDETVYQDAEPATNFVQLEPHNGQPSFQPSEVYFFYDQTAIYIGAMLYDSAPDSIFNFLSERDNIGMSDYFGVYFDPYNEGQLAYGFFITPAGVQTDLKAVKREYDYENGTWNAVWESSTRITSDGWTVEMRIPYSALRFPDKEHHSWGVNMFRRIRRYNSNNSWNFIDRKVSGFIHQEGELTGISNIKPPVRLSFSPYAAVYYQSEDESNTRNILYKGGMDVKYGISESFTLDMMLIPDFGQIQSDNKQLNLSPYELYYDEQRQFFTEGVELFQRADIFYSRRIGGPPKCTERAQEALRDHEEIEETPTETRLLNATKISGRTEKGLGLGLLNAMSSPSYATVKDTLTSEKRKIEVQPFTNYNVVVIDQSLKNNSYISLINANMAMSGDPFYANVTATEFQIRNKAKTFAISGKGGISDCRNDSPETGYFVQTGIDKNSGKLQFGLWEHIFSDDYNPNDLGYLRRNNTITTSTYITYMELEPHTFYREWRTTLWWDYNRMYYPNDFFDSEGALSTYILFKNNYSISLNGGIETLKHDYFEARSKKFYYKESYIVYTDISIQTDQRKPINFYGFYRRGIQPSTDHTGHGGDASINFRIGQRLQLNYGLSFMNEYNDRGFVVISENEDAVFFARRNVDYFENILQLQYVFNNKAGIKFRLRHYWSDAFNKEYYQLQNNGELLIDELYHENKNENYNAFNVDMVYRWVFAPGSELTIAWKNAIYDNQDIIISDYFDNLHHIWHANQINSISLKVLYYLDYNNVLRKKRGNTYSS